MSPKGSRKFLGPFNDQPVIPVNLLQLSFTGALQHSFNVALLLIAAAARRLNGGGVRVAAYPRCGGIGNNLTRAPLSAAAAATAGPLYFACDDEFPGSRYS